MSFPEGAEFDLWESSGRLYTGNKHSRILWELVSREVHHDFRSHDCGYHARSPSGGDASTGNSTWNGGSCGNHFSSTDGYCTEGKPEALVWRRAERRLTLCR